MISLIIILSGDIEKSSRIIVYTNDEKSYRYLNLVKDRIRKYSIKFDVFLKDKKILRALGISDIRNKKRIKRILEEDGIGEDDIQLVNFGWTQTIIRYPASMLFGICKKAIFVEEGATQVVTPEDSALVITLKKIYGNQTNFWQSDKIGSIYVQNVELYREYLKHKLEELVLNFDDSSQKDILCDVFMKEEDIDAIKKIKERNILGVIFTQPLSEDGYLRESEKILVYSKLINYYGNKRVCLKVHPRDCSDYHELGVPIITGEYPSELLNYIGVSFSFAIGLCTSAIQQVKAKYKYNLNQNYLKELTFKYIDIPGLESNEK